MSGERTQSSGQPEPSLNDGASSEVSSFEEYLLEALVQDEPSPRLPGLGQWLGGRDGRRFEVLEELGHGAMGWVFRARDSELQRKVALKFLLPRKGLTDVALREARAIARLSHEHIIRIFDVGEWSNTAGGVRLPFLVMECLEGESLTALLRRVHHLEPKPALEMLDGIVAGLTHAHEHHVIHRDLKPSNVFITRGGTVKLLDFGLAWLTLPTSTRTPFLPTAGTPAYMAPEQWLGAPQDERTDIWASGVILFQLLTGTLPTPRAASATVKAWVTSAEPMPSVRAVRPELPQELDAFLTTALAKEPSRRFPTAREMLEELREVASRLGFAREASHAMAPQRRQVAMVSCQLTGLTEPLDPEELGELDAAFHQACGDVITHHGGSIVMSMGGEVLACFGYLRGREDDSERAVRAALHLARHLPEVLRRQLPHLPAGMPAVRLGVCTDRVVLEERAIQGEAPRFAVWLARQVGPGEVALGNTTWRLVRRLFESELLEPRAFESLSGPMRPQVYRVVGEREAYSRFDRALADGGLMPLVGRERELRRLLELWERARSGQGACVLVSGEAGIGKSRLLQELREQVASSGAVVLMPVQCWPRFSAGPLQAPIAVLQHLLRFSPDATPAQILRELTERMDALGMSAEQAQLIGLFFALPVAEDAPLRQLAPDWRKQRAFEALVELLRRAARERPLLITVEDLQWADSVRLELLGALVEHLGDANILVALSARPEFHFPWPRIPWFHQLGVERLSAGLSAHLSREVARGRELPAELLQALVRKTDGVPLFIEEMTRMVLEQQGPDAAAPGGLPQSIPVTLRELLLARLDLLPSRQKALVQLCAVVGRDLSLALLVKLTGRGEAELRWALAGLEEAGLLQEQQDASGPIFQFRHVLIQETAWLSLSRRERQRYHQNIARVLEAHFPQVGETRPEVLAHHYTEAGEPEKAFPYWERAGRQACLKAAHPEAVRYLSQALALLRGRPESPERNQQELGLLMALGGPLMQTRGFRAPEVKQAYARVRELIQIQVESLPADDLASWDPYISYAQADFQLRHWMAGHIVAQGEQREHRPRLLALGHRMLAVDHLMWGQMRLAREHIERSMAFEEEVEREGALDARHGLSKVSALSVASLLFSALGEPEAARRYSQDALALAERVGHPHILGYALTYAAVSCQLRRETREALDLAVKADALASAHDFGVWLAMAELIRGWTSCMLGQEEAGLSLLKQGIERWRMLGLRAGVPYNFILLAEVELRRGWMPKAVASMLEAQAWQQTTGEHSYAAELHRIQGELLRARRQEGSAKYCFFRAIALARQQGAGLFELRATVGLGQLLRDQGRWHAARRLLARTCARLGAEQHDSPDFRAARTLLAQLAEA
ncbi:protein kinase [Pyxidicoccus fallax]|uniref:Protein kinase n=1 Tax=Pyxidicoccus fallax TaxID=394095 RepID=A0A848LD36_9BACT|nr:AAA family ATPase [Pyxidicoccus fallax]NMO16909.1 protein kinase [Pyxidicoccus fallax]NPC80416.1 protein kinase [Pyxidicoccus fallax]